MAIAAKKLAERVKRRASATSCQVCGAPLVVTTHRKHDEFWLVLLMVLGAALAFFLIGAPIMIAALWLWSRTESLRVCQQCDGACQATNVR